MVTCRTAPKHHIEAINAATASPIGSQVACATAVTAAPNASRSSTSSTATSTRAAATNIRVTTERWRDPGRTSGTDMAVGACDIAVLTTAVAGIEVPLRGSLDARTRELGDQFVQF